MKNTLFKGVIAYPITPFDENEKVNIPLFRKLTERLVTSGSHAIAPLGSTGVLPYLSDEEKEAVTEATIQQVAGRVPTLVGVSNLTTENCISCTICRKIRSYGSNDYPYELLETH